MTVLYQCMVLDYLFLSFLWSFEEMGKKRRKRKREFQVSSFLSFLFLGTGNTQFLCAKELCKAPESFWFLKFKLTNNFTA